MHADVDHSMAMSRMANQYGVNFNPRTNRYEVIPGAGVYPDDTVSRAAGALNKMRNTFVQHGTVLSGQEYQNLRSDFKRLARSSTIPDTKAMFNNAATMLDQTMERSIQTHYPQYEGMWAAANDQYKRLKVLQLIASRPGEVTARGYTSPAATERAAKEVYGEMPYAMGRTPFSAIGNAGAQVMKALADSGTSQRARVDAAIHDFTSSVAGIGGALIGGAAGGGAEHAVLGLLSGEKAAPTIARIIEPGAREAMRKTLMNRLAQRYYGNQLLVGRTREGGLPGLLTTIQAYRQKQEHPYTGAGQ